MGKQNNWLNVENEEKGPRSSEILFCSVGNFSDIVLFTNLHSTWLGLE